MTLLSKNSIVKLNDTVRTVQNTPVGNQSRHYRRKPASSDYPHMAINRTEDELKIGYIVEVVAFAGDKNLFTIQQPSADDLPNVAVVLTPAVVGHMVALSFTGPHMLWTALDTGQDTPSSWGSTKDSYEAKEGTTFTHISHTSFLGDTNRVSATFAGGAYDLKYLRIQSIHWESPRTTSFLLCTLLGDDVSSIDTKKVIMPDDLTSIDAGYVYAVKEGYQTRTKGSGDEEKIELIFDKYAVGEILTVGTVGESTNQDLNTAGRCWQFASIADVLGEEYNDYYDDNGSTDSSKDGSKEGSSFQSPLGSSDGKEIALFYVIDPDRYTAMVTCQLVLNGVIQTDKEFRIWKPEPLRNMTNTATYEYAPDLSWRKTKEEDEKVEEISGGFYQVGEYIVGGIVDFSGESENAVFEWYDLNVIARGWYKADDNEIPEIGNDGDILIRDGLEVDAYGRDISKTKWLDVEDIVYNGYFKAEVSGSGVRVFDGYLPGSSTAGVGYINGRPVSVSSAIVSCPYSFNYIYVVFSYSSSGVLEGNIGGGDSMPDWAEGQTAVLISRAIRVESQITSCSQEQHGAIYASIFRSEVSPDAYTYVRRNTESPAPYEPIWDILRWDDQT